jgi:hypothetical protein
MSGEVGASLAERIERDLRGAGLSDDPGQYDSNIHSWRCEYPDIYGPCSCLQNLIADIVACTDSHPTEGVRLVITRNEAGAVDIEAINGRTGGLLSAATYADRRDWEPALVAFVERFLML